MTWPVTRGAKIAHILGKCNPLSLLETDNSIATLLRFALDRHWARL